MKAAMEAVKNGRLSVSAAAKRFCLPRETLRRRVTNHVTINAKAGRPTILSKQEEDEVVETCQIFGEWGFGLQKEDVKSAVTQFLKHSRRKTPFRDGIPGDDWWAGFLRRQPTLVKRKPQQLQLVWAHCSRVEIVNHRSIECLKPVLDSLDLHESPSRIFNVDEVGFPLSGRVGNVFVKRGTKSPQSLIPGSGRDNITEQICCSASGELLPLYIVFTGQRLHAVQLHKWWSTGYSLLRQSKWMDDRANISRLDEVVVSSIT